MMKMLNYFECEDATDTRVGLSNGIEEIFARKQRCERIL